MTQNVVLSGGSEAYSAKNAQYFSGARNDWIALLSTSRSARILEIGCGNGDTGAAALAAGKCGFYAGVEIYEPVAREAREKLNEVHCGDVEHLSLPYEPNSFDAMLISEVLEHLVDPCATLSKLGHLLKPGAIVLASSPNVAHYRIISMLLAGRWDLTDKGTMDRTHLRWFTPSSYRQMFVSAGYAVEQVGPVTRPGIKTRLADMITFGTASHLFMRQINLRGRKL